MKTQVLIVGAGPVGLSASVLLSRHGIRHLICDRAASTTDHPRARSINIRTNEIFRQWGIEGSLRAASLPPVWNQQMIYTTTLAGPEHGRTHTGSMAIQPYEGPSPSGWLCSSQDKIEPILRQTAESYPTADVRFGTEYLGHEDVGDGIRATLRDRAGGDTVTVEADYMIGADGFASRVRDNLGVKLVGETGLAHSINTYFRADLDRWIEGRPAVLYWISGAERAGVLQPLDGGVRWLCQIGFGGHDGKADAWTAEDSAHWIRQAVGAPEAQNTPIEILKILPWTMSATMAEKFQAGRVFLVGDALHQLPPTGGFGANSGVQDAHNLCWKLAAVLNGWAAPSLLDSYEAERRPIAKFNIECSVANFRAVQAVTRAALSGGEEAAAAVKRAHFYGNFIGQELGFHYEAGAVIPDGSPPPPVDNPVTDYVPSGRPGHRAPHVELRGNGKTSSVLDLFETEMVLLAGPNGTAWRDAARAAAGDVPLAAWTIGEGGDFTDPDGDWRALYGVEADGAVLVRPDGHVAWRSFGAAPRPQRIMTDVFDALFR